MYIFIKSTYCSYYVAIQKWVLGFGYPRVSVLGMDFDPKRCSGRVRVLSLGFGFRHICHFTHRTNNKIIRIAKRPTYAANEISRQHILSNFSFSDNQFSEKLLRQSILSKQSQNDDLYFVTKKVEGKIMYLRLTLLLPKLEDMPNCRY